LRIWVCKARFLDAKLAMSAFAFVFLGFFCADLLLQAEAKNNRRL
jgi:hypothetical protein